MALDTLINAIMVHRGLLNELLQVFERETSEMGDVNITAMNLSNQTKEKLIAEISGHSALLRQAIVEAAEKEGLPSTTVVGALAEHLSKKGKRDLAVRLEQLRETTGRVQRAASLNQEIAVRFSDTVSTTLNLITRLINQSNVYGASGGYQQRNVGAVMINREA